MKVKILDKAYILHNDEIIKGYVVIKDNTIDEVKEGSFDPRTCLLNTDYDYFDLTKKLILPGFANTHTHSPMILLRGLVDDKPLKEWLGEVLERENRMTKKAIYWATILAQMEMVSKGVTVFGDMYFHADEMAKAVDDFGMRALITRGLVDIDGDLKSRLDENLKIFNEYIDHPRIKIGLGPHAPYTCSKECLKKIVEISKELGIKIMIHLLETSWEKQQYSLRDLLETGIFSENTLAVHVVHADEEDIQIIADTNTHVVSCPVSNLKLYDGIAPIGKMLDKDIKISLGTDGASSNNSLDVWRELTFFDLVHRDEITLETIDLIKIASKNGYMAMGFEDIGEIKKGFKADLTIIDLFKPHYFPNVSNRILSHVIYSGNSGDVFATMVDGNWLYFDGEFKTVDFDRVIREFEKAFLEVEKN
ncbi:MAG: amidohydrolase [Thermotogae bacterium]|nr:amidohydrolase [Thermotogota bacterium]